MTQFFFEVSDFWQTVLLVLSLITIAALCCYFSLTFCRGHKASKQICAGGMLLFHGAVYVLLQLDSRIAGATHAPHWPVPYIPLILVTLLSLVYALHGSLGNTASRKTINNNSIKEAYDNLPTGVCFFNEKGLPILCNHAMHRFSFAVTGKDVQYITDSEVCLREDFQPVEGVKKEGKLFLLPDQTVHQLDRRTVSYKVVIVTSMAEHSFIEKAKQVGADSFWYKDASQGELLSVMERTMAGEHIFPNKTPEVRLGYSTSYELTTSELEVIRALMQSTSDEDAAAMLCCSKANIRWHLGKILDKTGYRSRMELLIAVAQKNLIIVFPDKSIADENG